MKNPNNKIMKKIAVIVSIVFLSILSLKFYYDSLLDPVNKSDEAKKIFVVQKGDGISAIVERLEKEKLIKNGRAFSLMARNSGESDKIQAGDFKLSPAMSSRQILKELTVGMIDKWVTLVEGWRVEEMAAKLNQELGIKNKAFIDVAEEGYMFPDTYLFNPEATAETITSVMRANFDKKYNSDLQNKIKKLGLSPKEGVILASIVEREARSPEARKMVASILLKRLKIDMGINADATIQYALVPIGTTVPLADGWWKRNLARDDLKIDSPYNTYLHRGLPPAPISNPSLSALQAVGSADPSTPYLYYYHDSKGVSHYGKTLEEHNQNVANYP
ncbi:hypothetical protein A2617_04605 [Candidatus Daviesbacteria bacterium RIFOXYD1_FULL_41_10]|nr:MAG: hypothetical protein A2617_04605 [Candidatus Daviesbacteria bacterium RIFOXYD1_FULL_41_10]